MVVVVLVLVLVAVVAVVVVVVVVVAALNRSTQRVACRPQRDCTERSGLRSWTLFGAVAVRPRSIRQALAIRPHCMGLRPDGASDGGSKRAVLGHPKLCAPARLHSMPRAPEALAALGRQAVQHSEGGHAPPTP